MALFTGLSNRWEYAWWFPAIYVLVTIVIMIIYGMDFTKRFFRLPGARFKGKIPTIFSSTLFSRGIMAYAVFVPIQTNIIWFWLGVSIFSISTILSAIAMINFATTPNDQPVTKGMYRFSRNPVQVLAIIMLIGIGLATVSWIIIAASLLLVVISYPTFLVQERSCLEIYGSAYSEYMSRTPRWVGIPKTK